MTEPYLPAVNVAQIDAIYDSGNNPMENVFHVLGTGGWNLTNMENLAAYYVAWESDHGCSHRSQNIELTKVSVTDLTTQTAARLDHTTGLPVAGIVPHPPEPNNVTLAIKKQTASRGRSFRGRVYWIGLWDGAASGDSMNSAFANPIVDALEVFRANLSSINGGQLVVLSRRHNNAPRVGSALATVVTGFVLADYNLDSQRRRLVGHNRHR